MYQDSSHDVGVQDLLEFGHVVLFDRGVSKEIDTGVLPSVRSSSYTTAHSGVLTLNNKSSLPYFSLTTPKILSTSSSLAISPV